MRYYFYFGILLVFFSCDSVKEKEKVIAKVKDQYLYENDLADIIPGNVTEQDSIFIRRNYITNWVKEQLIYQKALITLSSAQKNKDRELKNYYNSLLRFDYQRTVLAKNIDSLVTDEEVQTYYEQNLKNFELKRNIIRLLYVKLPLDIPETQKPRNWIRFHNAKNAELLKSFADEFATNYSLDTSIWFYFDDITKEVPIIEEHDPEHFIRNNRYVELKDDNYLYMINIIDNRIRDELSPLVIEKEKIKQIILNKRGVKLIEDLENRIYREGMQQNLFEIYN